jgi:hypothetical protein
MVNNKLRGGTVIEGARVDNGTAVTPNSASGITLANFSRPARIAKLTLTATSVAILAANDYGSVKLCDLPEGFLAIVGVKADLVVTGSAVITDVTVVDYAVGTVALTSIDFSNAGEDNLIAEGDVAALGVLEASSTAALSGPVMLDAGAKAIYLNLQAAIATNSAVTVSGTVEVMYLELGL